MSVFWGLPLAYCFPFISWDDAQKRAGALPWPSQPPVQKCLGQRYQLKQHDTDQCNTKLGAPSRHPQTRIVCEVVAEAEVEYRDRLGNRCCLSVSTRPSKDHSHQATCMQSPDLEIYFCQKEAKLVSWQKLGRDPGVPTDQCLGHGP